MNCVQRFLFAAAALVAISVNLTFSVAACGPYTLNVKFSLTQHADFPLAEYAAGKTGIVPPTFGPMSLVVFYRQLNGAPLSKTEQTEVVRAMETQIYYLGGSRERKDETERDYLHEWLTARAEVAGDKRDVTVDKQLQSSYQWITNCLPDAFETATKTLNARLAEHGKDANVREWIRGQDIVFANCGDSPGRPEPLDAAAPEWLKRDRAYQIAAAGFYRGEFAVARDGFEKIAADGGSPWNKTARFVAARTLVREANMTGDSGAEVDQRRKFFEDAASRFEKILADPAMSEFHRSANRMLGLIKYRVAPAERLPQLASTLSQPADNANIYHDLTDFTWLLHPILAEANENGAKIDAAEAASTGKEYDYNYVLKLRDIPVAKRTDELVDWLFTYKSADGFEHAVERWRTTRRLPWLVAAISNATSANSAELVDEAARVPADSPASATVRYHRIRLLLANGDIAAARKLLDEVLADRDNLPLSTRNKFLAQRMSIATNLDDFLRFAPRRAVIFEWDYADREEGNGFDDTDSLKPWVNRAMFDDDAVAFMNEKMPLAVLREAALSKQMPAHLKRFLVIAVWTRAFAAGNRRLMREFTPLMQNYAPEFRTYFSKYAAATTETDREAAALLFVLRYPVIQPFVPVGFGRDGDSPVSIDSNRGNWWCSAGEAPYGDYNLKHPSVSPAFLTAAQVTAAARERRDLAATGNSSTMLARRVVEFADRFPNHPKTPELLHLAIRSTRFGCSDENTAKFSKQAFDRLHQRYSSSVWTEKSPYWFGNQ